MGVVVGQVVGDTGLAVCTSPPPSDLRVHFLAGGGLHQRRAAEEDGALVRAR
jgi:hypothetical protein